MLRRYFLRSFVAVLLALLAFELVDSFSGLSLLEYPRKLGISSCIHAKIWPPRSKFALNNDKSCSKRRISASAVSSVGNSGFELTDKGTKSKNIAIHVTRSVETSLRKRHPWVFENEIRKQSHEGQAGDVAVIFDSNNSFLSAGLFDPYGPIRVRVLQHNQRKSIDAEFIRALVRDSVKARDGIMPANTDGYRLVNGENDGLAGVVMDKYADTIVIKLYSACWIPWLSALQEGLAQSHLQYDRIVLLFSRQVQKLSAEVLHNVQSGCIIHGAPLTGALTFQENGILFEVDPINGQKTGFFLDQRENRMRVERLTSRAPAAAARVLNVFSYTGGFSLYAARGGATEVTSVDVSAPATAAAERNFALNRPLHPSVRNAAHVPVAEDAFEWMREAVRRGRKYDIVIVDPPSMANKAQQRKLALERYEELAGLAVRLTARGGTAVLASCSSRVSADDFFAAVHAGAAAAGRPLRETERTQHATDHPVRFPEGAYLKCLFATVP